MLLDIEVHQIDGKNIILKYIWRMGCLPARVAKAMESIEDSKIYEMLSVDYNVAYASMFREDHPPAMTDDQLEEALDRLWAKNVEDDTEIIIPTVEEINDQLEEALDRLWAKNVEDDTEIIIPTVEEINDQLEEARGRAGIVK